MRIGILALMLGLMAVVTVHADPLDSHLRESISIQGRTITQAQVRDAVLDAATERKWTVIGDNPGKVMLRYSPRTHVVVVEVDYDATGFKISYVSSENMEYKVKKGLPYIHGNYNRWVANLAKDIRNSPKLWAVPASGG